MTDTQLASHYVYVPGIPAGQGLKKYLGKGVMVESSKRLAPWRHDVREAVLSQGIEQLHGPLYVELTFYLPRPRGHYGTGRNADKLKPSAPRRPCGNRDDVDKFSRAVLDAITSSGAWQDDGQVVTLKAAKFYANQGTSPGVAIHIMTA